MDPCLFRHYLKQAAVLGIALGLIAAVLYVAVRCRKLRAPRCPCNMIPGQLP